MNDYTPSDAAKAYSKDFCTISHPIHRSNCPYETSFDAGIAHERESRKPRTITTASELAAAGNVDLRTPLGNLVSGNDHDGWEITGKERAMATEEVAALAPLTLLVPASESAPEPERLTDADDERIKPGARVRCVIERTVIDDDDFNAWPRRSDVQRWFDQHSRAGGPETVFLLAEAPDADLIAALVKCGLTETAARGHLAILREAGLRVDQ